MNYLADLRAFLRWNERTHSDQTSVFDLDAGDVQAFRTFLQQDRSHAPATVNRRLQALRKFYTLAVAQGWTDTNPADEVALLSETVSHRSRFMTADDVSRLLAAVGPGSGEVALPRRWADRDWAIIQAFLGAGLKLSELTALHLADVHLDEREPYLVVRGEMGQPDRSIPLDAEVCSALRSYIPNRRAALDVEHLFINRDGNPLSTRSVQRLLRHYAQAANLDELTTQALRYIYARKAYENCHNHETVARLLGHRHLATTIRYLRPGTDGMAPSQPGEGPSAPIAGVDDPEGRPEVL